jgi:alpha-tubulin suppressor-like RCC1 family protein
MGSQGNGRTDRVRSWPAAASLLATIASALIMLAAIASAASAASITSAWGLNDDGQLGDGTMTGPSTCLFNKVEHFCSAEPLLVEGLTEVTAVAAGQYHSLALLSSGAVMAWGRNSSGQLGNGTTTGSDVPVVVGGLGEVTAVAAGATHSLALLGNGTVVAWGNNEKGELGNGTRTNSTLPVAVSGLTEVVAIAAGNSYSLALLSSGTVEAWGANEVGQLGDGSTSGPSKCTFTRTLVKEGKKEVITEELPCAKTPVAVTGVSGATSITAGFAHSLSVLSTGAVKAWGYNAFGQLGDGTASGPTKCRITKIIEKEGGIKEERTEELPCAPTPVAVTGLTGVSSVAAGEVHSLAATTAGGVDAWGGNEEGQLGNGSVEASLVPIPVNGLTEVTAVAAGGGTSMALLQGGTVMGWGSNFDGQLGEGTTLERLRPTRVCGLAGVLGITTRGAHSLAVGSQAPACPTVTGVAPSSGPTAGGTAVTISGTNLAEATAVRFGNTKAASFTVESPTTISAVSPAGSGTVGVTVATPLGTSVTGAANQFSFVPPPSVTHVVPASGPSAGGSHVTISGTGFSEVSAVEFGSNAAMSFTVESPTTIQAVSPAGSSTVDVRVTTPQGTSLTNSEDRFTYLDIEAPEFGRCVKVTAGTGGYGNGGCTLSGGERKYEWYSASGSKPLVKRHFTAKSKELTEDHLTTKGGQAVSCTVESASGEYNGAKTFAAVLTFTGCHLGSVGSCQSSGAAEGEVVTMSLAGQVGVIAKGLEASKNKIGLDLKAAAGETFAEMSCAGTTVVVTGSVIAEIKANSMLSKATLKYSGSKGVQKPNRFEAGEEDVLVTKIGEAEAEKSVLTLTTIQTNEEKVEVNSVV